MIYDWFLRSPAWTHLSPNAKTVYVLLRSRFDGKNNGLISLSAREAGTWLSNGDGKSAGARALRELAETGFIVIETQSAFNRNSRIASQYRLTELPSDVTGEVATKDFMRWRPVEKQNVVPFTARIVPPKALNNPSEAQKWTA